MIQPALSCKRKKSFKQMPRKERDVIRERMLPDAYSCNVCHTVAEACLKKIIQRYWNVTDVAKEISGTCFGLAKGRQDFLISGRNRLEGDSEPRR